MPLVHDETEDAPSGNVTVHAPGSAVPSWDPLNVAWAGVKGAGKEAIQNIESLPFTTPIPNEDKKDPVMNWAESSNPEHPYAEQAGRLATDIAPMALIPELDVAGGIANAANSAKMLQTYLRHPRVVSELHRFANAVWKGGAGGALASRQDPATGARIGAETGVGADYLRRAAMAMPHKLYSWPLTLAALASAAWYERGRVSPYLAFHAGQAIPTAGAAIAPFFPPGVAGALGERAAAATGYDRGNQPPPFSADQPEEDELGKR